MKRTILCTFVLLWGFTVRAETLAISGFEITTSDGNRICLSLDGRIERVSLTAGTITRVGDTIISCGNTTVQRVGDTIIAIGKATISRVGDTIVSVGDVSISRVGGTIISIGSATITRVGGTIISVQGDARVKPVFAVK